MPRTLNVHKLERKLFSVTRSKESIQNLSSWIIHHKAFNCEIVEEWLKALEKGDTSHRLTLFYVANDVLQHCRKRDAPEFRASFAEVLERAFAFVNDIIKDDVLRILAIWSERGVYSTDFLKQLEDTLSKGSPPSSESSDDSDSLSEAEIIASFRPKDLILGLKQLTQLQQQIASTDNVLNSIDDVEVPPFDNIRSEGVQVLQKFESLANTAEDYFKMVEEEVALRKKLLKLLDHSKVFYVVQNEEVKKVVHAYRIFGKKVKNLRKSLIEKKCTILELSPVPVTKETSSPIISDSELSVSSTHSALFKGIVDDVSATFPDFSHRKTSSPKTEPSQNLSPVTVKKTALFKGIDEVSATFSDLSHQKVSSPKTEPSKNLSPVTVKKTESLAVDQSKDSMLTESKQVNIQVASTNKEQEAVKSDAQQTVKLFENKAQDEDVNISEAELEPKTSATESVDAPESQQSIEVVGVKHQIENAILSESQQASTEQGSTLNERLFTFLQSHVFESPKKSSNSTPDSCSLGPSSPKIPKVDEHLDMQKITDSTALTKSSANTEKVEEESNY